MLGIFKSTYFSKNIGERLLMYIFIFTYMGKCQLSEFIVQIATVSQNNSGLPHYSLL